MAGAAWNLRKMIEKLKGDFLCLIFTLLFSQKLKPSTMKMKGW
jgi:hypothetical protein